MRIVYYSGTPFADSDFPLVRRLQMMGHEVHYFIDLPCYHLKSTLINIKEQIRQSGIFSAVRYAEFRAYAGYISLENVYVVNRLEQSALHPKNIAVSLRLASMIRRIRPDVMHIIGGLEILSLPLLRLRKRTVLTVHDPFPHTGEQSFRREFFRKLAMTCLPRFVLLNERQRADFIRAYGLRDGQVHVNRMGAFDYMPGLARSGDGGGGEPTGVLFFGRISPYKGVEYLLEAMTKVHEKMPQATLTVVGGGRLYFDASPFESLPYIKIINRYVGMEELAGMISRARVVVCPYTDATQSGVIMTAYGMCKPVVASDVGGLAEMVDDGKSGILVPPKDVDALADAILKLLGDERRQREMREYIKEMYFLGHRSWEHIAEKYLEAYRSL